MKLLPDVAGDRIKLSPLKHQPCRDSVPMKLTEQLVGHAGQQAVTIIEPAVYESMHQLGAGPSRE